MSITIPTLPAKPGVYLFRDEDKVVYVGKANNLKERVKNHIKNSQTDARELLILENSKNVSWIEVDSEIEALVLEANLIKKHKPRYNIRLKDDKDYLYIKISKEEFPRVLIARRRDLTNAKRCFGPYPTARIVRSTLRSLRKLFPYCSNPPKKTRGLGRPCFFYHLSLCPGVCAGVIDKKDYRKIINRFISFLSGKKEVVIRSIEKEMNSTVKRMDFEKASALRDQLKGIEYLTHQSRAAFLYEENPDYLKEERAKGMISLQSLLKLKKPPDRIEGYDISNLYGKNATGSMVVLIKGELDRSQYRRFKIKYTKGINDYGMMKEVIKRRFNNNWPLPDLIVIDGGRGQLNVSVKVLELLGVNIPVISLAKREEEIYVPYLAKPIRLDRASAELRIIQKIRDEAHRFAITYHKKLRLKQLIHEKVN